MSRIFRHILLLLLFLTAMMAGCSQSGMTGKHIINEPSENQVTVIGTRFVDSHGRQIILSGVNEVNKQKKMNYLYPDSQGTYKQLAGLGVNVIRLGIIWDAAEPEPGRYDDIYMNKLEEKVNQAAKCGIYVLLDMHQDLFSVLYSDGAPQWATLTDGQEHITGEIWSDAYEMSPAVQRAFDNFWANKPAPDGKGLQEHYINMWKHIAVRFAHNKAVLGYDIMNEPFNGSQAGQVMIQILTSYAKLYAEETGKVLSQDELIQIWSDQQKRFEALARMQTSEKYSKILDGATESNQQFEKMTLQPFFQKASEAIREADTTHILFLEHAYFGNTGIRTAIEPVTRNGKRDPRVAYAPHGYDLLVDTKNYSEQSNFRIELIFKRMKETSDKLDVPVLVGEWGAFSGNSDAVASNAAFIIGLIEKSGFSNTYWAYYPGIESELYFRQALVRPYPQFIGGILDSYQFNDQLGIFTCSWKEIPAIKAPTDILIPEGRKLVSGSIAINGEKIKPSLLTDQDGKATHLIIPVTGKSVSRTLEFRIGKNH
jgi:endoglycosylceramidase